MTLIESREAAVIAFVDSEAELREIIGQPSELVIRKQLPALDAHSRNFIAHSPFALLATSGLDGTCDVSPRGDGPGFVRILDDGSLAIPDRPGNRRIDSLLNVMRNPHVGLLFLIPGVEDTLRVNGRARIVREAPFMDEMVVQGKRPKLAILVEPNEVFFHCAKAFKRSRLWQPEQWPDRAAVPSLARVLKDQLDLEPSVAQLECDLEEAYKKNLY